MHNYTINKSSEIGFDLCGIVKAEPVDNNIVSNVEKWISKGMSASLNWMNNNKELRYNPSAFPELEVKSIVVCGISYHTLDTLLPNPIASYAHFADYHYIIKELLNTLHCNIEERYGSPVAARAFSDSAPVLERYWAEKSGLGWVGKSSMLINKDIGSYFLLGTLLLDIEFDEYSAPSGEDRCGSCTRCIDNCKSGAIQRNKTVDCNKCLSYITIEHRGEYSPEQQEVINKWEGASIFGCDQCQSVCPWNIKAARAVTRELSDKRDNMLKKVVMPTTIEQWSSITPPGFKSCYKHTPLSRAGYKKIKSTIDVVLPADITITAQ